MIEQQQTNKIVSLVHQIQVRIQVCSVSTHSLFEPG